MRSPGTVCPIGALPREHRIRWDHIHRNLMALRSPFLTHEFCTAVEQVRGDVYVLAITDKDSTTVGYFPFQYRRHLGRALGFAEKPGAELSDYFAIIADPTRKFDAVELLAQANLQAFRFDHLPTTLDNLTVADSAMSKGVKAHIDSPDYLSRIREEHKTFFATINRYERQLVSHLGKIKFTWQTDNFGEEVAKLIACKRAQFKRTNSPDVFAVDWKRNLVANANTLFEPSVRPILSTLYAGGQWIASHLGLGFAGTLHSWFPVYNYEYRKYGPGNILIANLVESAVREGFQCIDFGQGTSEYKMRYGSIEYSLSKGFVQRCTLRGGLDRLINALRWRIAAQRNGSRSGAARPIVRL
jgi:CelD/BcsL family acetyltransferase involved in cellulose biosynthesis